jgi:iron complex outermembrane receptor protein
MTYAGIDLFNGNLDITLSGNHTETDVKDVYTAGGLAGVAPEVVFSSQAISQIEEWQPEDRVNLSGNYVLNNFQFNLSINRFGEYTVEDDGRQDFDAVYVTDLSARYTLDNGLGFTIGGNNVFDEFPDKNEIGNSRGGTLETSPGGEILVDSPGIFDYSRRSAPFGFNGAYWYAGVSYDF